MTYYLLFLMGVFVPFLLMYFYQRGNKRYYKYPWGPWNELCFYLAIAFFVFVVIAPRIFPGFYLEFNEIDWGRAGRKFHRKKGIPYEFFFAVLWFLGLSMMTFPHVYKQAFMPVLPTGLRLAFEHKTGAYKVVGCLILFLCVVLTVNACMRI